MSILDNLNALDGHPAVETLNWTVSFDDDFMFKVVDYGLKERVDEAIYDKTD